MDPIYPPRPPPIHYGPQQSRNAHTPATEYVHDIDHRPFLPIYTPFRRVYDPFSPYATLPRPRGRYRTLPPAYWETFETDSSRKVDSFNNALLVPDADVSTHVPLVRYNYPPIRAYADNPIPSTFDGSQGRLAVEVEAEGRARSWLERRKDTDEEKGVDYEGGEGEKQRTVKPSLTPKEKLRRQWIVTKFCVRLRVIRTQRWFRERIQQQ